MRPIIGPQHIARLFSGYTEHALHGEMGITDPKLVDYVASLLLRFLHQDDIYPRQLGRRRMALADMLENVEHSPHVGPERRELFRHLGDFALFWTGVFPEAVERSAPFTHASIEEYTEHGKRSYYVASTYRDTREQEELAPVLRGLSEQFEVCAVGLRRARDLWEADRAADNNSPGNAPL